MMSDAEVIVVARELALVIADRCSRSPAVVTESVMLNKLADSIEARSKGIDSNGY